MNRATKKRRAWKSGTREFRILVPVIQFEVDNGTINKYLSDDTFPTTKCFVYAFVWMEKNEHLLVRKVFRLNIFVVREVFIWVTKSN